MNTHRRTRINTHHYQQKKKRQLSQCESVWVWSETEIDKCSVLCWKNSEIIPQDLHYHQWICVCWRLRSFNFNSRLWKQLNSPRYMMCTRCKHTSAREAELQGCTRKGANKAGLIVKSLALGNSESQLEFTQRPAITDFCYLGAAEIGCDTDISSQFNLVNRQLLI